MNHAITILGYGNDGNGSEFWIGQNSWSKNWGEGGYIRISTQNNICGILNFGLIPILDI